MGRYNLGNENNDFVQYIHTVWEDVAGWGIFVTQLANWDNAHCYAWHETVCTRALFPFHPTSFTEQAANTSRPSPISTYILTYMQMI